MQLNSVWRQICRHSVIFLAAYGAHASGEAFPDRHMRPLRLRLPVFYLERMVSEQATSSYEHWLEPGQKAVITTQVCQSISEVLQPNHNPLRTALIRQEEGGPFSADLQHRFTISQSCGSTTEFELKLNVRWYPAEQRVNVGVVGLDADGNLSGSAEWEFTLTEANPNEIHLVIPQNSFQSGMLFDFEGSSGACHPSPGACSGFRVTSFRR